MVPRCDGRDPEPALARLKGSRMPLFLMANQVVNISGFDDVVNRLSAIKTSQLRFVASKSLNELAYWLRENERNEIARTFNRVAPFTLNAPLYTKSDKSNLSITLFLRDTAGKGTPPSVYLYPQVEGGEVYVTGFTRKLRRSGLIGPGEYAAHWASKTQGRLTGGRLNQILFGLGAGGPTLRKQGPRTAKQAGVYFIMDGKRKNTEPNIRVGRKYKPRQGSGYTGPGIYTRSSGQLEQVIPIYAKPLEVPKKYDWTISRFQRLADDRFRSLLARNLDQI